MRVLHLYAGNLFGGIERMLLALWNARGACECMRPQFALCFEGRLSDQLRAASAPLSILGAARRSRPWTVAAARRRLRELLRKERFEVAVTHSAWPHGLFAPAVRSAGVPLVMWMHDVPTGRGWIERWARRVRPDLVLANSGFTASHAFRLFEGVRCVVQYPAIEPPEPIDRASARRKIRADLQTHPDAGVIVMASRWERWKGHEVLLRALSKLPKATNWACWIAGEPQRPAEHEYLSQLQEQLDRFDIALRVRFLGHRDDLPAVFAAADVYCQPNTGPEPFGIVFVEAMAAGLPVITSDMGAAPEIVNSSCGRLLPPHDTEALAAQLDVLLSDSGFRKRLADAAVLRASQLCDMHASLDALHGRLRSAASVTATEPST